MKVINYFLIKYMISFTGIFFDLPYSINFCTSGSSANSFANSFFSGCRTNAIKALTLVSVLNKWKNVSTNSSSGNASRTASTISCRFSQSSGGLRGGVKTG